MDRAKNKLKAIRKATLNAQDLVSPQWEAPASIIRLKESLLSWIDQVDEKTTEKDEKILLKFLTEKITRIFKDDNLIMRHDVEINPRENAHDDDLQESISALEGIEFSEFSEFSHISKISKTNSDLVSAVKEIAPTLYWYKKKVQCEEEMEYSNANIIGKCGIIFDDTLTVGLTVMPANTMYPEHHHKEAEFYVVLSSASWNQKGGDWVRKSLGDYVYNPSNITHATKTDDNPLVTIWFHYHPTLLAKMMHGFSEWRDDLNS